MKKNLIPMLVLSCLMVAKPTTLSPDVTRTFKAKEDETYEEDPYDDEIYQEDDYQYDEFLEEIIVDASMDANDSAVEFEGMTTPDYGQFPFRLAFDMNSLQYDHNFTESMVEVSCETANIGKFGMLNSQVLVKNPDTDSIETYYTGNYRNTQKLEDFVMDTDEDEIATYAKKAHSLFGRIIKAIVTIYVIVTETAEQIKGRLNYYDNKQLEEDGNGMELGNYIYNQEEVNWDGYNCGDYKFGFTTFKGVGCEVASIYNLMINEGMPQKLSQVIYDFEKWAIEFSVGWGYLGSNPRDIYRYLLMHGISYSRNTLYAIFNFKVQLASVGTRFIYSAFNQGELSLHTFFIIKKDGYIETYNFNSRKGEIEYFDELDDINSQMGAFIVGYKIND